MLALQLGLPYHPDYCKRAAIFEANCPAETLRFDVFLALWLGVVFLQSEVSVFQEYVRLSNLRLRLRGPAFEA